MTAADGAAVRVTPEDVELFARASGDRNPLHVSGDCARRTPFGAPVVHGALGVLLALAAARPSRAPAALDARFHEPLLTGRDYAARITADGASRHVTVADGSRVLLDVQLRIGRARSGSAQPWTQTGSPAGRSEAADLPLDAIEPAQVRTLPVPVEPAHLQMLLERTNLQGNPAAALLAPVLCWGSYVAGMEVPGRQALVAGLSVELGDGPPPRVLPSTGRVEVTAVDERFRLLQLHAVLGGGWPELRLRVLRRDEAPACDLPTLERLLAAAPRMGGQTAVVVGASRGLGGALAAALAMQGAAVHAVFHRSRDEADALLAALGPAGHRLRLEQGDAADAAWCRAMARRVAGESGRLDVLVLNACPPVGGLSLDGGTAERAVDYVARSLALAGAPLAALASAVEAAAGTVVGISSAWVEEPPRGWWHYASAKAALEGMLRAATVEHGHLRLLLARPPRLLTGFSGSPLTGERALRTEPVAAAIVRALVDGTRGRIRILESFDGTGAPDPAHEAQRGRLGLVATFAADPLVAPLSQWSRSLGLELDVELAGYAQVVQELLDPAGTLGRNRRGCNVVLVRLADWGSGPAAAETVEDFVAACRQHAGRAAVPLVVVLCPPAPGEDSETARRLAEQVTGALSGLERVRLVREEEWCGPYDLANHHDEARLRHAHIPYTPEASAVLAATVLRAVHSLLAPPYKVLVLDCDDTLWGGVCAEEGPEGVRLEERHVRLQRWAADLAARGVLVCLCSKNAEEDVLAVFDHRTDFHLTLDAATARRVNWEPKPDNIRALAEELGVGLDSVVFLDDNPMEVAAVRAGCPEVLALAVPSDPSALDGLLARLWAFDAAGATDEDRRRTSFYRADARRRELRDESASFADFVARLRLRIDVREAGPKDLGRLAQMTQRTNQFNTSGVRRSGTELRALLDDTRARAYVVDVADRLGDYGTVAAALAVQRGDALAVEAFLLSCRALGRGVEHALLAHLGAEASRLGVQDIEVAFRPTARNTPARRFLDAVAPDSAREDHGGTVVYRLPAATAAAVAFRPEEVDEAAAQAAAGQAARSPALPGSSPVGPARPRFLERVAVEPTPVRLIDGPPAAGPSTAASALVPPETAAGAEPPPSVATGGALLVVREVFAGVLGRPVEDLHAEVTLESLRLPSLAVVDCMVALEERFGRLPQTLVFEHRTLGSLAAALASRGASDPRAGERAVPPPAGQRPVPAPAAAAGAAPWEGTTRTSEPPIRRKWPSEASPDGRAVAVVGLAGRYPGARTVHELWANLVAGRDSVGEIPPSRWDHRRYFDPQGGPGRTYSGWAALLDDIASFDPLFFGIAPAEAELMDPQQRLFLEVAYEALQDAGHTAGDLGPDVGVYVGFMASDYAILSAQAALDGRSPYPYAAPYQIANRVSHVLDLTGPSLSIDTACSASGVALHLACEAVRAGRVRAAIAGGVNVICHPSRHVQYAQMGMLARDGRCGAFGDGASGFVMGEGVGAVVLRPLDEALADGDQMYGVIRGSWLNADGRTNGFTVPNPRAQADLVRRALEEAGVDARTVSYVEAHGSGTPLGDPVEVAGLTSAFGGEAAERGTCGLGSVKSNIGHLESAAAIAGLTKVLLQLRHRMLVPTLHAETLNPRIDFSRSPFVVQRVAEPWRRPALPGPAGIEVVPRRAGLSSFGAGGVNVHLVVEERDGERPSAPDEGPQLVLLSAPTDEGLRAYAGALGRDLRERATDATLADVAFTLREGREALASRCALVAIDRAGLIAALGAVSQNGLQHAPGVLHNTVTGPAPVGDVFDGLAEGQAFLATLGRSGELARLAALWTAGVPIDWSHVLPRGSARRAGLATYPFARERYWLPQAAGDAPAPEGAASGTEAAPIPDVGPDRPRDAGTGLSASSPVGGLAAAPSDPAAATLAYRPVWRPGPAAPPQPPSGTLLVCVDLEPPAAPPAGCQGVLHVVTTRGGALDGARVLGRDDEGAWRSLLAESGPARHIVVADGARLDAPPVHAEASLDPLVGLALARTVVRLARDNPPLRCVTLGRAGCHDALGEAVIAFGRSVVQERPGLRWVRLETDATGDDLATLALREAFGAGDDVRVVQGRRWVRKLERLEFAGASVDPRGGVVVVTGGGGWIGRLLAGHLARRHGAAVALLGRRAQDPAAATVCAGIEREGGRALYVQADVTSAADLDRALRTVRGRLGPLTGVVHAAGVLEDARADAKDDASLRRVLAPKVTGTILLDAATLGDDLDYFVLMSSVVGTLGNAGQADYAAANRFLDAYAAARQELADRGERRGRTRSIAWPPWAEGGMRMPQPIARLLARTVGLQALSTPTALDAFERALAAPSPVVFVAHGHAERLRAALETDPDPGMPPADQPGQVEDALRGWLVREAAALLKIPEASLDPARALGGYGANSVLLVALTNRINEGLDLALQPTEFFEHPTLAGLAASLAARVPQAVAETLGPAAGGSGQDTPSVEDTEASRDHPAPSVAPPVAAAARAPEHPGPVVGPEAVAIVGMAGRFPGADDLDAFWEHLVAGRCLVREVPPERWEWQQWYGDPHRRPNATSSRHGGFLDAVDAFDTEFFGILPREAHLMDPQQRLFVETCWAALEDAGYDPSGLAGSRTGVFAGVTLHEYLDVLVRQEDDIAGYTLTGNVHSVVANRVSFVLDLRGPSESIDTACSSSLVAIHRAITALRGGECDLAVAGGVNVLLSPTWYVALSKAGMLSRAGHCKAFDAGADGYVRGEGVGAVVLKRLEEAVADRDPVHGVIRGSAVGHGGRAHSLTAPNPAAQSEVVTDALRRAGVPPSSVTLVETHGTGTELGDPIEVEGLRRALGAGTDGGQDPGPPCVLGAVKASIGHLESAAGVAGLIATLLAMRHRRLPPNALLEDVNPYVDLAGGRFRLLREAEAWEPRDAHGRELPLRAGVSSFGFGGTNAHLVVEEPTEAPVPAGTPARGPAVVVLSARTGERLRAYAEALRSHLERTDADLHDIAYTSQVGRLALDVRTALVATSRDGLRDRLDDFLAGRDHPDVWRAGAEPPAGGDGDDAKARDLAWRWVSAEPVDWSLLHEGARRRVRLPTYPFCRQRHGYTGIGPPQGEGGARSTTPASSAGEAPMSETAEAGVIDVQARQNGDSPLLLRPVWFRASPPPGGRRPRVCLLLLGCQGVIPVQAALDRVPGVHWVVARERCDLPLLSQREREFDLSDAASGGRLAEELLADHPDLEGVVDLVDATAAGPDGWAPEEARVALLQELLRRGGDRPLSVLHVTRGRVPLAPAAGALAGARMACLVRVLDAEYGAVHGRAVDVEAGADDPAGLLDVVAAELTFGGEGTEVCYRAGQRYLSRLDEVRDAGLAPAAPDRLGPFAVDPDGWYLLSGGTGGLGLAVADRLVRLGARRVALLGRRPLDRQAAGSGEGDDTLDGRRRAIARLRDAGAEVALFAGPLSASSGLDRFVAGCRARWGRLGGVVHCAGTLPGGPPAFLDKDPEAFATAWEPKGTGLLALEAAIGPDQPDFFVLFSSLSAVVPELGVGLSDYASANAFLDAFAADRQTRRSRTRYLAIDWGSWSGPGMGEVRSPRYREAGYAPLEPEAGLDLLEAALSLPDATSVVAVATVTAPISSNGSRPAATPPPEATAATLADGRTDAASAPAADGDLLGAARDAVTALLAAQLMRPAGHIGPSTPFADLGVDSILIAGIVSGLEDLVGAALDPSIVLEYPSVEQLAEYLVTHHGEGLAARAHLAPSGRRAPAAAGATVAVARCVAAGTSEPRLEPLAIIGLGTRFPGAADLEAFWTLLREGRSAIREVPPTRWDVAERYSPRHQPGKTVGKWGGFLDDIEWFDPGYFGIPEEDAAHVDPVIRVFLEVAEHAVRDAGYQREELAGKRVGVFVGAAASSYGARITEPRRGTVTGLNQNFVAAHVAQLYDLRGPNTVLDTACSSSLASLHVAQQSLHLGACDMAFVGAADLLLDETPFLKLSAAQALSPDGICHVFDEKANGIVIGEGAGCVVVKRLSDALADGDRVLAVVESCAMNNDGRTMGLTTPNPQAQEAVVREALEAAGVEAGTVSYVEVHGTGTMIGDPMELQALTRAFRHDTAELGFCAVGSVKTNIGHLLMAAGMAGLAKVVLSLRHRTLPATLQCETPNPRFRFEDSPLYPNRRTAAWEPPHGLRRAGVSAFGFGGVNCHAVIRELSGAERAAGAPVRAPLPPPVWQRAYHWVERPATGSAAGDGSPSLAAADGVRRLLSLKEVRS